MDQALARSAYQRAADGAHTALVGVSKVPSPAEPGWTLVRVHAGRAQAGPLEEARRRIERVLGDDRTLEHARQVVFRGLRRQLLGDEEATPVDVAFVAACNRLAQHGGARAVLVVDAVDAADDDSLTALAEAIAGGRLRLPLVLGFRDAPAAGAAHALLDAVRAAGGDAAVLQATRTAPRAPAPRLDAGALPPEVLLVLRAGCVVGAEGFEASIVGALLEVDEGEVLETLQRAVDLGVVIDDHGDGVLALADDQAAALTRSLLPSLRRFWHTRLGELLGEPQPAEPAEPASPTAPPAAPVVGEAPPESARDRPLPDAPEPDEGYAEMFHATAPSEPPPAPEPDLEDGTTAWTRSRHRPAPIETEDRRDVARAARHLVLAGRLEEAAQRYLDASADLAARGDLRRALASVEQALDVLDHTGASHAQKVLRTRALTQAASLQWRGATTHPAFTLQAALESLRAARHGRPSDMPPQDRVTMAALYVGVCCDLGELPLLEEALEELADAGRSLADHGEPKLAARLLNDQAAIYLRMGDPVRATHLLKQSRDLFESLRRDAPDDPLVLEELAETDHLLARLPLHVAARPGRETDALELGLDYAKAAERLYERLDDAHELGRVWETMGRLEMARARLDRAAPHLRAALDLQAHRGDVTGLARTTAALSDLLVAEGRPAEALRLLAESLAFNVDKGSPLGLAFNRRALAKLEDALGESLPLDREGVSARLTGLKLDIAEAEAMLGAIKLPGESDDD